MFLGYRVFINLCLLPVALFSPTFGASLPHIISSSPASKHNEIFHLSARDANITSGPISFRGWTPQPTGRGTLDIIWSCVFTIFLCCWSVLCVNIPADGDNYWKINWRKFCVTCLGIIGPEFTLQLALGQWISASRSVKQFHDSNFSEWTMKHAFFADMGGFVLHPADWVPFPIDSKQLHYLVVRGHLSYPKITKAEINDRNKVDTLLRVITVLQTLWFFLNSVARAAQGRALTTFELTTNGFIFCTLGTYFFWGHKPADVEVPIILDTGSRIKDILVEAGEVAKDPYSQTPLDFISRKEWSFSLWWSFAMSIFRKLLHIRFQPKVRPITRMPNDNWLEIPPAGIFMLGFVDMLYAAIYMIGWDFWFATNIERALWRISTSIILGIVVTYLLVELYAFHLVPALPAKIRKYLTAEKKAESTALQRKKEHGVFRRALSWMRNNSSNNDPRLYLPLKANIPISIAAFCYSLARAYLIFECLFALRKLPSSAYESVDWSSFLPHV